MLVLFWNVNCVKLCLKNSVIIFFEKRISIKATFSGSLDKILFLF